MTTSLLQGRNKGLVKCVKYLTFSDVEIMTFLSQGYNIYCKGREFEIFVTKHKRVKTGVQYNRKEWPMGLRMRVGCYYGHDLFLT